MNRRDFILSFCVGGAVCLNAGSLLAEVIGGDFSKAKEFTAGGGLPNFYRKLFVGGGEVKIAYFGGSITAQKGWRCHSLKYFQNRFPKVKISEINAAIGGTGSTLGAYRLENDVLKHKPDLVFVEFATNDSGTPPNIIKKNMEGIVRHIWKANPRTDICFVYTITTASLSYFKNGRNTPASMAMDEVAAHYDIPVINMSLEIAGLEKSGGLVMKTSDKPLERVSGDELNISSEVLKTADGKIPFSSDGVHPHINTGHVLYERSLERAFAKLEKFRADKPHSLAEPMRKDNLENGKMVSMEDKRINKSGKWGVSEGLSRGFKKRVESVLEFEPEGEISFKYCGRNLAMYNIKGIRGGSVDVYVDGKFVGNKKCYDGYAYDRLSSFDIFNSVEPKTVLVRIVVSGKTYDKTKALKPKYADVLKKYPEEFAKFKFFPAALLMDGELSD